MSNIQYKYFPHTNEDIKAMLERIGVKKIDDLFSDIPDELKNKKFNIPTSMSEVELRNHILEISKKNKLFKTFRGAGSYDVYVTCDISG